MFETNQGFCFSCSFELFFLPFPGTRLYAPEFSWICALWDLFWKMFVFAVWQEYSVYKQVYRIYYVEPVDWNVEIKGLVIFLVLFCLFVLKGIHILIIFKRGK